MRSHDRQRTPPLRLPRALCLLRRGCACQPCQVKRACLQKLMTLMARTSPGVFELVEAWALEDHDD